MLAESWAEPLATGDGIARRVECVSSKAALVLLLGERTQRLMLRETWRDPRLSPIGALCGSDEWLQRRSFDEEKRPGSAAGNGVLKISAV